MELCLTKLLKSNVYDNNECIIMLNNVKSSKVLFELCFDIFCKSLVILYGTGNTLNINILNETDLNFVKTKLEKINIRINTLVYDVKTAELLDIIEFPNTGIHLLQKSLQNIRTQPDNLDLKEYIVQIQINDLIMEISFEIIHNKQVKAMNFKV